jgi:hypothetical protein
MCLEMVAGDIKIGGIREKGILRNQMGGCSHEVNLTQKMLLKVKNKRDKRYMICSKWGEKCHVI